jgi:hypothetical protein
MHFFLPFVFFYYIHQGAVSNTILSYATCTKISW